MSVPLQHETANRDDLTRIRQQTNAYIHEENNLDHSIGATLSGRLRSSTVLQPGHQQESTRPNDYPRGRYVLPLFN